MLTFGTRAVQQPFDVTRSMMRAMGFPIRHNEEVPSDIATEERNPIVLVHGYMDNGKTPWWKAINAYLKEAGWEEDELYHVSVGDVPATTVGSPLETTKEVRYAIHAAHNEHDSQVDVIAHSMGGLAARWCVEKGEMDKFVDTLVTLGSPHQSTKAAYLGFPTQGGRAMIKGSDFLTALNADSLSEDVSYTALWSPADLLIAPSENAKLPSDLMDDGDENIRVDAFGHIELVHHPDVFETVTHELTGTACC